MCCEIYPLLYFLITGIIRNCYILTLVCETANIQIHKKILITIKKISIAKRFLFSIASHYFYCAEERDKY